MTIKFPALMMLVLLAAASTASAQSANRSASGTPAAPGRVETLAPERGAITRCRAHCDGVTVAGPHASAPRQSAAERLARQSHCSKRMAAA
jgi:hypothetical protein